MRNFFLLVVALVATIVLPGIASAEILWSYSKGLQTHKHDVISSCQLGVCFYTPATKTLSPTILNEIVTSDSEGITFTATAATDPNFADFVGRILATDNGNDRLCIKVTADTGMEIGVSELKSVVFNGCPPLNGIDSVSLALNEFVLENQSPGIWGDGKDTYVSERFTFSVGAPEPSSIILLMIGVISVATIRNRKK